MVCCLEIENQFAMTVWKGDWFIMKGNKNKGFVVILAYFYRKQTLCEKWTDFIRFYTLPNVLLLEYNFPVVKSA